MCKKYLINDEPASARDIILLAKEINAGSGYVRGLDGLYLTSVAAKILRCNGYTIGHNPDYITNKEG